jgi:cytoskeleton protein RodZ
VNSERTGAVPAVAPRDIAELAQRLREEREALGWTLDETAQKLKMPASTLASLEAARFERLGTPVYLKGYLRSYARLLGQSGNECEAALAAGMPATPPILPATGAVARRVAWLDRYKWAASYVVGTALALTAVHWLVNNTPQLGGPSRSAPERITAPLPPVQGSGTTATAAPVTESSPPTPASLDPVPPAPVLASLTPFGRVPFEASATTGDVAETGALVLHFDERSWIEVKGADGRVLRSGLVAAGAELSFDEGAPFAVRIGNVKGVRVSVGGLATDLSAHSRGNVATFRVARGTDERWRLSGREAGTSQGEG